MYKEKIVCMLCNKEMNINEARVEWSKDIKNYNPLEIHICHKNCSEGYSNPRAFVSDFDIIGGIYTSTDIKNRLDELENQYPYLSENIAIIKERLFK